MSDGRMLLSCGAVILSDSAELFLARTTGSPWWGLPKGLLDPGETPLEAAVRETREETGVLLEPPALADLGVFDYLRNKRLHLFALRIERAAIDPARCRCTSLFYDPRRRRRLPEVEGFAWVPLAELGERCNRSLAELFASRLDLDALWARLPPAPRASVAQAPVARATVNAGTTMRG